MFVERREGVVVGAVAAVGDEASGSAGGGWEAGALTRPTPPLFYGVQSLSLGLRYRLTHTHTCSLCTKEKERKPKLLSAGLLYPLGGWRGAKGGETRDARGA